MIQFISIVTDSKFGTVVFMHNSFKKYIEYLTVYSFPDGDSHTFEFVGVNKFDLLNFLILHVRFIWLSISASECHSVDVVIQRNDSGKIFNAVVPHIRE